MKFARNVNRLQLGKPLLNQGGEQSSLLNLIFFPPIFFFPIYNLLMGTVFASVGLQECCGSLHPRPQRLCLAGWDGASWLLVGFLLPGQASSGASGKTVKPRGFLVPDSLEQGLFFTQLRHFYL